jgi:hypothetical protein
VIGNGVHNCTIPVAVLLKEGRMTTELRIKNGPSKLDLMLALFDSDARGPRFITFKIEGFWYHLDGGVLGHPGLLGGRPPTEEDKKTIEEKPYILLPTQEISVCVNSVRCTGFGDREEWDVAGKVHGHVTGVRTDEEDIPFRANISTKTRWGTIEFD